MGCRPFIPGQMRSLQLKAMPTFPRSVSPHMEERWRSVATELRIDKLTYQACSQGVRRMAEAARTPGAVRAGAGNYMFELAKLGRIMGGPDYSTAAGTCVEGDRMMVALMRMPAGTGAEPHSHPNEQWIYILEGTFAADVGGRKVTAHAGSVVYIPADTVHSGGATPDADVLFFTVKDTSHSLHGHKAA